RRRRRRRRDRSAGRADDTRRASPRDLRAVAGLSVRGVAHGRDRGAREARRGGDRDGPAVQSGDRHAGAAGRGPLYRRAGQHGGRSGRRRHRRERARAAGPGRRGTGGSGEVRFRAAYRSRCRHPSEKGVLLNAETIELDTPHGPMLLYEVRPDGSARGAVIVIQEAFGVNAHIEDVTRRFADTGYHAVAPHVFHRAGGGTAPYGDFSKVLPLYEHLDDAGILVDVDATREHLHAAGWDDSRIGIVGFCFGGRVTFLVALRRRL